VLLFCIIYIGKEKQREFGDLEMVKKESRKLCFKPVLKLGVLLLALTG
jgi:hypothetical protein